MAYTWRLSSVVKWQLYIYHEGVQTVTINGKWDLIIAHPPCTYISNAGVRFLYPGGNGILNEERLRKGIEATHFFLRFLYADCEHIAVENPIPSTVYCLPKYTQIIQPWMFGHPVQKKTCLWLKGLPKLQPTDITEEHQKTKGRITLQE